MKLSKFFSQNKKMLLFFVIFVPIFYLQRLITFNIGYDTDEFLMNPAGTYHNWLGLDRYVLVFLKKALPFLGGNLFRLNVLTCVNWVIFGILSVYFLNIDGGKTSWKKNLLCGLLLATSPIFLEQYYFTLQSAEVSFAAVVMAICFIITYRMMDRKRAVYGILLIPLLVFCFGIYQSFVNLYIAGVLICLYKLNEEDSKENLKRIGAGILIWLASTILYLLISGIVKESLEIQGVSYLSEKISWLSQPFSQACFTVITMVGRVILGHGHVLNLAYTICLAVVLYDIFKQQKKRTWRNFLLLSLLVTPFLLNLVTGSQLVIRSAITFPVFCVFIYYEYYSAGTKFRFAVWLILASQIINSQLLLYGDNVRNKSDIEIAEKIYRDCSAAPDTPIVFLGLERAEENAFSFKGQVMGHSFFEWSNGGENAEEIRILYFMTCHDMPFALPSQEQTEYGKQLEFSAEYPKEGYIQEYENCYYVNLGE